LRVELVSSKRRIQKCAGEATKRGCGDELLSGDAARGVGEGMAVVSRLANRARAATVTRRQSRLVDPGSAASDSSSCSQTSAASLACCGPQSSVTAFTNAASSRSASAINSTQFGLPDGFCAFTVFSSRNSVFNLQRYGCGIAMRTSIKPKEWGGIYWTKVSTDTFVW